MARSTDSKNLRGPGVAPVPQVEHRGRRGARPRALAFPRRPQRTAGTRMADTAACAITAKSVHLIGDNGGLSWFTQLFPYPDIAQAARSGVRVLRDARRRMADGHRQPLVYSPDSPFQKLPANAADDGLRRRHQRDAHARRRPRR